MYIDTGWLETDHKSSNLSLANGTMLGAQMRYAHSWNNCCFHRCRWHNVVRATNEIYDVRQKQVILDGNRCQLRTYFIKWCDLLACMTTKRCWKMIKYLNFKHRNNWAHKAKYFISLLLLPLLCVWFSWLFCIQSHYSVEKRHRNEFFQQKPFQFKMINWFNIFCGYSTLLLSN